MKGFPQTIEGPKGPWLKKVNEAVGQIKLGSSRDALIAHLGDPDKVLRREDHDVHPGSGLEEVWYFIDPYRPTIQYAFHICDDRIVHKVKAGRVDSPQPMTEKTEIPAPAPLVVSYSGPHGIFAGYSVHGSPLVLSTGDEVRRAENVLGTRFPLGYREYVTTLGEGVLGGTYVRIYPPARILEEIEQWRQRIREYWFWDAGDPLLSRQAGPECTIIGDTVDGDELIVHPRNSEQILVLPRHNKDILVAGIGLAAAIEWLCSSGAITGAFSERIFQPFACRDSEQRE